MNGVATGPLYEGENLHVYPRTMFGAAYVYDIETEDGDEVRVLEVGGVFESATYLDDRRFEPTFAYYHAFDHLFEAIPEPNRVLMIGGGGYAYPKHFIASRDCGVMDVVEIDPMITRIARRHFFLGELIDRFATRESGRLNLVTADGREYLAQDGPVYDVVINDSFSGGVATSFFVSDAGLEAVKAHLASGGLYMINVICDIEEDARDLLQVVGALRESFEYVHVIPCVDDVFGDADNNLVIATDGSYSFTGVLPPPPEL